MFVKFVLFVHESKEFDMDLRWITSVIKVHPYFILITEYRLPAVSPKHQSGSS